MPGFRWYLVEGAIFTSRPHPTWSGAALINRGGKLAGGGSRRIGMPSVNRLDTLAIDILGSCDFALAPRGCNRHSSGATRKRPQ